MDDAIDREYGILVRKIDLHMAFALIFVNEIEKLKFFSFRRNLEFARMLRRKSGQFQVLAKKLIRYRRLSC